MISAPKPRDAPVTNHTLITSSFRLLDPARRPHRRSKFT
jgi:hypothetical protein